MENASFHTSSRVPCTRSALMNCDSPPSPQGQKVQCHLPERVPLLREQLEVLVGQLCWGQSLQSQVGPALHEVGQVHKGVRAQAVIPVVGQVGHENADLKRK